MKTVIPVGGWVVLAAVAAFVGFITSRPAYCFNTDDKAQLAVSFKNTTPRLHECGEAELKSYISGRKDRPRHMRNAQAECGSRERYPLALRITVDGEVLTEKEIPASGWRHDTSIFVLEQKMVSVGHHAVTLELGEKGTTEGYPFKISREIDFGPRDVVAFNFKKPDFIMIK